MSETEKYFNPVQSKVECIFKTEVKYTESSKRPGQSYKVVASSDINTNAVLSGVFSVPATEKVDGTCCYVGYNDKQVELFARLDRKPNKKASKKFKMHTTRTNLESKSNNCEEQPFIWKYPEDFKPVPELWIPAKNVKRDQYDMPYPDKNGHTPGWVPISVNSSQYCWHTSIVDEHSKLALVLQPSCCNSLKICDLILTLLPLSDMVDKTYELIGTNINGNPYLLGSKRNPFHVLVRHGSIPICSLPSSSYESLKHWFDDEQLMENKVEGLVWHCANGNLFKLHRHHLGLPWPFVPDSNKSPFLSKCKVKVDLLLNQASGDLLERSKFGIWSTFDGKEFNSLIDLSNALISI